MSSRYADKRGLRRYLAGAAAARAGDEMSGPALLLLGYAMTRRPETGSGLLASLTIAGAAGGPLFGALLDRSGRPDRLLAWTLAAYALGIVALQAAVGRLPMPALAAIALLAGLFNPAVAAGWTAQLPRVVTGRELDRGSALDALTFSAASLAGPALAAGLAAGIGARAAVLTSAGLAALAVPAGRHHRDRPRSGGTPPDTGPADGRGVRGHRGPAPAAAGHRDLGGVLRRHRHAPGLLPAARRAAPRRGGPRRAADQRDRGRLADRQCDPGPSAWSPAPRAPGCTAPQAPRCTAPQAPGLPAAGHAGARQHAGDRGEHGRGGADAGLAHPGRGRAGRGGRGPAADRAARGTAPGNPRAPARAGLHHGGQPEDRGPGGRGGAGRADGRVVGDRLPADRGGHPAGRRGGLPAGRTHPPGTAGADRPERRAGRRGQRAGRGGP